MKYRDDFDSPRPNRRIEDSKRSKKQIRERDKLEVGKDGRQKLKMPKTKPGRTNSLCGCCGAELRGNVSECPECGMDLILPISS